MHRTFNTAHQATGSPYLTKTGLVAEQDQIATQSGIVQDPPILSFDAFIEEIIVSGLEMDRCHYR
ncbi:hypothetical protein [Candidatus Villigracilis affinis]|uniref:hypothetical protein n=1 Tax=Candidatus Villigracilis affinis TaxID=3140682 RepID=UPI002A1FDFB9|nr:hypothetical protein [Anaerolineales bacterium]